MRTKKRTKSLGAHPSADRSHLGDLRPAVPHAIDAEVEDLGFFCGTSVSCCREEAGCTDVKEILSVTRWIWSVLVSPSPTERRGGGMSGCVCFNRPAPKPAATGRPPLLSQPGPCARAKAATKREASMGTPPAWLGRKKREGNRREGRQAAQKSRDKAFYPGGSAGSASVIGGMTEGRSGKWSVRQAT